MQQSNVYYVWCEYKEPVGAYMVCFVITYNTYNMELCGWKENF